MHPLNWYSRIVLTEDGFGPIYGSLIEVGLKSANEHPEEKTLIYNSLPPPSLCPSCHRGLDDDTNIEDGLYEDLKSGLEIKRPQFYRLGRTNRRDPEKKFESRRRKYATQESRFGMNTLGHLRIDYSGNWNKLDRYIGQHV
ncbi:uncharacterized protein LOC106668811 isoform X2 [Cimex lectularius]|uniref:Uncharacterized protein n=1 Tax=Cimex lectularius TaxID=79782 RepID=A0A8I6RW33_CIMLE|nr:uncharacterized protein LOC106668811 isoform X2 [Cimex lectularius]